MSTKSCCTAFVCLLAAAAFPRVVIAEAAAEESGESVGAEGAAESPPSAAEAPVSEAPAEEVPPPAPEVPPNVAEARERVRRGEELFEQGNHDAALAEFQRAYDVIGEHPSRYLILYNIGQCHERSFRYDEALRFYEQYLAEGGEDADGRDAVSASIRTLDGLLATVRIEVNVPEAEVWVDERRVGDAPGEIRIPGGLHTVEVRAEGHLPIMREVRLHAGSEELLDLQLEQLTERFTGLHQAYFWSVGGVAVATLITGAIVGLTALSSHNELSRRLDDDQDRWNVTQDEIDGVGSLALGADVLLGLGAVFAVGTVILGLLTDWGGDEADSSQSGGASAQLGIAPNGLSLSGRF